MQLPQDYISIDDVAKVRMQVGKILHAEFVEGSPKLLKLRVEFGTEDVRQVVSGIRSAFPEPEALIGNMYPFITNLQPRMIMGIESQAMIIAAKDDQGMVLFTPTGSITPGTHLS